jgi:hypothetical protein
MVRGSLEVGSRVQDAGGFAGTIRYIGKVSSSTSSADPDAEWLGVEFDNPTRGKHDGAIEGPGGEPLRYFRCEMGGSGSFLKPSKVDVGVTMVEALGEQYVEEGAPLVAPNNILEDSYALTSKGSRKQIEFHGEVKIRGRQQIASLDACTLRSAGISSAGTAENLSDVAGHLTSLDIKSNLLSDWQEVAVIGAALPSLGILQMGGNRMRPLPSNFVASFASLRTLELTGVGISSWREVALLERSLPLLEDLVLARNNLSDVVSVSPKGGASGFKNLQSLDLSETQLGGWACVEVFQDLPSLRMLVVSHNSLGTIGKCRGFAKLQSLALSGNDISEWADVDMLDVFPALSGLRFSGNPVTRALSASEARAQVVARLPKLTVFNGSIVSGRERAEAEKSYLRNVMRKLPDDPAAAPAQSTTPHFSRLWAIHGESMAPQAGQGGTGALAGDMMSITLRSMAASSCTQEAVTKRLPPGITVGRLKQLCKRLFSLDTDLQTLYFTPVGFDMPCTLDDDERTLDFYGVSADCEIIMNESS